MNWFTQLTPDEYVASVYDIDLDKLWQQGKRLILTDLDNTLVPWNDGSVPEELAAWLIAAKSFGFDVCIVSNNKGSRVAAFSRLSGIAAVGSARKPRPTAFQQLLDEYGRTPSETVMLGDQLFTDIRGGNCCGLYTVLVLPISPREWWGTRMVRQIEHIAMRQLIRKGLQVPVRK